MVGKAGLEPELRQSVAVKEGAALELASTPVCGEPREIKSQAGAFFC